MTTDFARRQRTALDHPSFVGAWGRGPEAWTGRCGSTAPRQLQAHESGLVRLWENDAGSASPYLMRAAALAPDSADIWRELGAVAYLEGNGQTALRTFMRAARLAPLDAQPHRLAGLALYALGRFADAGTAYRRAVVLDPPYAEAHRNLGRASFLMGCFDQSAASYRRVVQLVPGLAEAWRNYGNTLYVAGETTGAMAAYRRAVDEDPSDASSYYNLGFALADLGRHAESADSYSRAFVLRENPLFLIGLRDALEAMDDPAAGRVHEQIAGSVRGSYVRQAEGRGDSLDPAKVVHLRPRPSREVLAGQGLAIRERPLPEFAIRLPDLDRVHPAARRSVEADQDWAAQGLSVAGPGPVTMRYHPTWTNSAIITDTHYVRDTYYNIQIGCAHSRSFIHPQYKRDVNDRYDWLVDLNPLPEIKVDEPCVVIGGSSNFGHFIGDVVSRMFVLEAFGVSPDLPVYVYPLRPMFREIIETLFPERRLVDMASLATGMSLFRFRHAFVPAEPPYAVTCPAYRRRIRDLGLFDPALARGERLFITRRNEFPRHRIGNEEEITEFLARRGFVVVCPAELGFRDLVSTYGAARQIVSPQGAQNANILFASPDCHFVEILPANQSGYAGALGYASIYIYNTKRYDVLWGPVASMDLNMENDAQPIFSVDALERLIAAGQGR